MINRSPLVLHVEDDRVTQALIQRLLETYGFRVIGANTADEAKTIARTISADAIVVDLILGDQSGVDLGRALYESLAEEQRLPPIIALSSSLSERRAAKQEKCFADVLSKPVCVRTLAEVIIRHIRRIPTEPIQRERARAARLHPIGAALTRIDEKVRRN